MELFGETHEALLREFLELPHGIPSSDTFECVFSKIDLQTLNTQFQNYMQEIRDTIQENAAIAIDGKTIRRSRSTEKKAVTDEKSNEMTEILAQNKSILRESQLLGN